MRPLPSLWRVLLSCALLRCHKAWGEENGGGLLPRLAGRGWNGSTVPSEGQESPPPPELMQEALLLPLPRSHILQEATVPQAPVCHGLAREPVSSLWLLARKSDGFRCSWGVGRQAEQEGEGNMASGFFTRQLHTCDVLCWSFCALIISYVTFFSF